MPALLEQRISVLWECIASNAPQRSTKAFEAARDIYSICIEQITEADLAYCSSVLLNTNNGIVQFLHKSATLDEFASCKDELLRLLTEYVSHVGPKILNYAISIKDVCVFLFSKDKTAKVKKATFPLLICILELCGKSDIAKLLNVPKIVDKYLQAAFQPAKHSATVRCGIFHLLGVLCHQFPEHMIEHSDRLIKIYTSTLKSEMVSKKGKKPELQVIAGCLKGLTGYLYNFTQSASEGSKYAQDIYNYMRRAIDPQAALNRYDVPKAGLLLLSDHGEQFKEFLAKDTEDMYQSLYYWASHNNRECKYVALTALESFFKQVSSQISAQSSDRSNSIKIYKEFMVRFRSIIDNPHTQNRELAVAIKGFGFFAKPCRVFGTDEDLHYMFSEMIQRSEHMFVAGLREVTFVEEILSHLPTFMQALASISAEIHELPDGFLLSLERLVVILFEYYPRLPKNIHIQSGLALLKLIMAVSSKPITFHQFLSHIVFQGLIRSCSHPVVIEAGDDSSAVVTVTPTDQVDSTQYKVASYKDYIEIWSQLLNPGKLKIMDEDLDVLDLRPKIHLLCYGEFIQAVIAVIKKLDLSSQTSITEDPISDETSSVTTPTEATPNEVVTSDPMAGLQAKVPKDFQIFINLVELCRKLLPSITPHNFHKWVLIVSKEIISLSQQYPLVSGFYKLLACVLNICKKIKYFEYTDIPIEVHPTLTSSYPQSQPEPMETDTITNELQCYLLFKKYIRQVLVKMQQYKDDLLSACLQLILSIPTEMVRSELDSLLPSVELSLKLGIGYLPLASTVVSALESWVVQIPDDKLLSVVTKLLPLLDDYLQTSVKSGEGKDSSDVMTISVSSTRASKGRKLPLKVMKQWKEGMERSTTDLAAIRERILFLLGSLGGVVNVALLERQSAGTMFNQAVSWDTCKKLEFAVPFSDLKPSIFMDPFLPRVCELSISSSDRQTKVAACEFLHAIVLFILGKSAQQSLHKKNPMTKIFKKVFPYLLQLGCDVERVAEQLFRPLLFQMIHWFTKNTQYESPDTMALLDSILDGIEHPTNAALRDFSGQCVREFLSWSIKQTSKKQLERSPVNTKSLLKRIYNMASHPSTTKRLGAALAINNIYGIFREEETLVDVFVIEMLVVMVNSLKLAHFDKSSLGTITQCKLAIGHIAKIIKAKSSRLSVANDKRRIPRGLKVSDLSQLVVWLLAQSGSPETDARLQSIHLFTVFAPLATKVLNTRMWIRRTIESEGGAFFVSRFERANSSHGGGIAKMASLSDSPTFMEAMKWMDCIQAALDCYIWLLKDQFVSPGEIFKDQSSKLLVSIEYYLSKLCHGSFESTISTEVSPLEEEQYNIRRCSIVSKILTLTEIILVKHTSEIGLPFMCSLWSQSLWRLVYSALFDPCTVGVGHGDYTTRQELFLKVTEFLSAAVKHLKSSQEHWTSIVDYFKLRLLEEQFILLERLQTISTDEDQKDGIGLDILVQGYLCMAQSNLLTAVYNNYQDNIAGFINILLKKVIELINMSSITLSTRHDDGDQNKGLMEDPANRYTAELALRLSMQLHEDCSEEMLILQFLLKGSDNELVLYLKYTDIFNAELVKYPQAVVTMLMDHSNTQRHYVSSILNGIMDYIQKTRTVPKQKVIEFCSSVVDQWDQLKGWWSHDRGKGLENKLAVVSLLQKILNVQPKLFEILTNVEKVSVFIDSYCHLVSDPKSPLTFKSKVLEILPSFLCIFDNQDAKLQTSLKKLVANQFPLKSTELPPGSPMYNDYITALDKLLDSLIISGSLVVLELIIGIACREDKDHVHEDAIQNCLTKFIAGVSDKVAANGLNTSFQMFINERDYPTSSRRRIGERICRTLLKECSRAALTEFFISHIVEIMNVVEGKLLRSSDSKLEDQLVSKLCCFQLLEVLYNRLTSSWLSNMDSKINSTYCKGSPSTGKELTQAVTKMGHAAKSEDLHGDKTLYDLRRQYHCHAYNMLTAVISCTQTKPQFYQGFLFKEDMLKGQYLLDNLIDPTKEYRFPIELETPLKRKKQMLTIRDELKQQQRRDSSDSAPFGSSPPITARYISSVYLAQSSLSADVSQYDFTHSLSSSTGGRAITHDDTNTTSSSAQESSYIVSEEQLEDDPLNNHECMVTMMNLLDHMQYNKITPPAEKGQRSPDMPSWMNLLHKKFSEGTTERNVRLFIARLIVNRSKIFQPYAKHWLPPLVQLIISGDTGCGGLHYFIVDIIATMLSWAAVATLEDRYLASRLTEFVMENCHHSNRSVFRNNLEIVRTLVECWKDSIQVPTKLVYSLFSNPDRTSHSNRVGIQLLGILLANDLPPYDSATAGPVNQQSYYNAFAGNVCNKYKEVYAAAGEVLGMLLAYMQDKNHEFNDSLHEIVINQLLSLSQSSEDHFIICLHKIQLYYSKIVQRFVDKLVFILPIQQGVFRSHCLEILQSQADIQSQLYLQLKNAGFHNMLSHRDEATQIASLKIAQGMLNQLDTDDVVQLLPHITAFSSHSSTPCRLTMYNILMTLYNKLSSSGDTDISLVSSNAKDILTTSRDQLLAGLSDDAEEIRLKMYEFWNQEGNLSSSTLGRLSQILGTLYSTKTEPHFLYHATNLLLELTSRSPDFNRSIFDTPLSECKFEDYKSIDLSWHQRHVQMTPLFAATQASQSGSHTDSGSIGTGSGVLRATQQSLAFTPTQDASGYSWMTPAAQSVDPASSSPVSSFTVGSAPQTPDSKQSSLLFTKPTMRPPLKNPLRVTSDRVSKVMVTNDGEDVSSDEAKRREVLKLKKRFLKSKEAASSYFANTEIRRKMIREEHRRHQKAARQSHVVMYRKYRDGELPDIQIKHSEIIRPLQALAQYDSGLARLLFASLFNAIFGEVDRQLTEEEAEATKKAVREGINTILESSQQYYPPFIGSLQDICYNESQLSLTPSNITTSSLISNQELIGIMLLEKQLLVNVNSSSSTKSSKRSKHTQETSEATKTWVEGSRLYKSLGEFDVVHGVFSNLDGVQDTTKKALEAEERGDYSEALHYYKEALGTPGEDWSHIPTQEEEDLWEDSLLNCYRHLTKWQDLETASVTNVDEPWITGVWEDTYYQEHYLPSIIQSKLKLWCIDGNDRGMDSFLEKSLQNETRQLIMESRYPDSITMAFIVKGDMDRAQYYLSTSLRAFQQEWSASCGDQVSNTSGKMQILQKLTEIKEFLKIMRQSGSNGGSVISLVDKWKNRYPDTKMDSIPIWDDIITNRHVMLRKLEERIGDISTENESISTGIVGGGPVNIKRFLSLEYAHMCMKIAEAACEQSNFPVSKKYLHSVETSIHSDFPDDQLLQLQLLHNIANMRLRRVTFDPGSPSKSRHDTIVSLAHRLITVEAQSSAFFAKNKSIDSKHQSIKAKTLDLLADTFATEDYGPTALGALSDTVSGQLREMCGYADDVTLDASEVAHKLWCQVISSYNSSIKTGAQRNMATGKMEPSVASLEEMASFCDRILHKQYDEDIDTGLDTEQFPSVVIAHTLKAMSLGSKTAAEQFSRLLQLVQEFPETAEQFMKKSSSVPCWMFIRWINQMVALLDKKEGHVVADILFELADNYPQALCFPFKVSSDGLKFNNSKEGGKNKSNFEKLKGKLRNQLMEDFVDALTLLNSPELVCKDMLDEIKPLLQQSKRDPSAIDEIWKSLYSQLLAEDNSDSSSLTSLYGTPSIQKGRKLKEFYKIYHKKIVDKFGKDGSKIHSMQGTQFGKMVADLNDTMKQSLVKQHGSNLLKEYSPWLDTFQSSDYKQLLEVPGQYDGKSKPLPEYHAKIAGFDPKILVLSSIRKPKRLTIIGDNSKEYMFLVKGGEDLRHDQRIEQLFDVMNGILCEDPACSQRQLNIRTYQVIPMTTRIGLIEWVNNTKPLKEFIADELSDTEKKLPQKVTESFFSWVNKFGGYPEMYKKAKQSDVEKKYLEKVGQIPWDLLRRGFLNMAATPEAFILLRSHFIKTLATVNICQYILGIGDRHLSNFMVDLENGGLVPIDFGHAFHTATQFLPFPELMPMRLTPQFTNLCLPHKHSGQLRSCMIHVLRALQSSPSVLLNTMDVFIKEPSVDWKNNARKQANALKVGAGENDSLWYPREKIRVSKKKLQRYNSAHLMLVDLKHGHGKKPEFNYLKTFLIGDKGKNIRARVGEKCASIEQQVDCLIDHATDPNILGRTYHGWEPWV